MILSCCKAISIAPYAHGNSCARARGRAELRRGSYHSMPLGSESLRLLNKAIEEAFECTSWGRSQSYLRGLALSS